MRRDEGVGVLDQPLHDGNLLDDLRDGLRDEEREAQRQDRPGRPDDQPARVGGNLAGMVGLQRVGHQQPGHQNDEGQGEEQMAQKVDPVLRAALQRAVEHVDPDMFVLLQRISRRPHEGRAEQIPLQLQQRI